MRRIFMIMLFLMMAGYIWGQYNYDMAEDTKAVIDTLMDEYTPNFDLLMERAEMGDPKAQQGVGNCYFNGDVVDQDYKEAVKWWLLAAEQGLATAQAAVGSMYFDGKGVVQNNKESVRWFRLAAEQGHASAQAMLGGMYAVGDGVDQDLEESYFWLLIAVANGEERGIELRDFVQKELSQMQMEQVQAEATKWFEEHQ